MLHRESQVWHYAIAVILSLTALLLMLLLDPWLRMTQTPFLLFFGVVPVVALYGGQRVGVFVTILAASLANYFFIDPMYAFSLSTQAIGRTSIFVAEGILISVLVGALRRAQHQSKHDVSQLKRTEEELRASQALFQSFMNYSPANAFIKDASGHYLYVNPSFEQSFNHPFDDWLGKTDFDFFTQDVAQPMWEKDQRVLVSDRATQELEMIPLKQSIRHFLTFRFPLQDAHGQRLIGGMALDISDRKQAEDALTQREEELRLITDAVPALIAYVGKDQRYRFINRTYQEWFGRSFAEVYGSHIRDVLGITAYNAIQGHVEQVLAGQQVSFESEVPYRDGGTRYVNATYIPQINAQGSVDGFVGLVSDISDRKRAEIEREHLLERERIARSEAEAANRIKDEFLAVLSHELRSPLNPILGWSKLLQTREFDSTTLKKALETIERNAQLQAQLIEDLLDVSRILQGKLSLTMHLVNLVSVIESAVETVRLATEAKGIHMDVTIDSRCNQATSADEVSRCQVIGDTARLQQVVWNLLSNAVKFTPQGGNIDVYLEILDACAQITVCDNGKGISQSFLPYVFDTFRQADSSTTRQFGGLGLGLAIVRHLVELHGGTVSVESQGEGQGAKFMVQLPLVSPERAKQWKSTMPSNPIRSTSRPPLAGLQVLIVDDETDSRNYLAMSLKQFGAIATPVSSAQEALQILKSFSPDVLISDVGMPETDGYTLIRQIRCVEAEQGKPTLPAIALTAYASSHDQQQALTAGFQQHLAKPATPEAILRAITSLLS